ncbi:phosphoadenylyl-sulfate reductase [Alteribacillus bidgolensis]|uniref:Adenosine 5'-phosphosulfate reductase n=1 Tax=Alteribacillus bidgolensis TaxID=930129 RepID=A0A1G8L7G5_9BACI|nr:phosphoadenylyl-sulfate reductase [Alteribacillus bidgolensis]SDI51532.1 phosphoadenylylsulfate reductase (thioredoxin) [Alteribacillus bidgolensis]
MLTYQTSTENRLKEINDQVLARKEALDVIRWGYEQYGNDLVYACSFGAEGIVLIDLISKIKPDAEIIFLDTDFHFKETYELIDKVKEKYPLLNIHMLKPKWTPAEQAEKEGDRLWETNPDRCCQIRKLEPLENALNQYSAWLSGLRREQSPTRQNTQFVNKDNRFSSIKICPLIHWTWEDVWMYIETFNLPYNPLHDQNYPSIGCVQCTSAVLEGDDLRSGRWSGQGKTECGLHK